ncbi:hypothetical protein K5M41_00980, partial [Serratia marcescens]|uniref:hypothetical protein n=2 Tax=Serratia marcescens TaxID=615 RepID=UPI001C8BBB8B
LIPLIFSSQILTQRNPEAISAVYIRFVYAKQHANWPRFFSRASLFCRMILCSADSLMHCPRIQSGVDIARAITYQIRQTPHLREAEPL